MNDVARLRSPSEIGVLAWILHRGSAIALLPLLVLHTGVALFPQYGFTSAYQWGFYGLLLDVTLGLVLLHGFFGVRATVSESRLGEWGRRSVIWFAGLTALSLFAYRLLG